ncbi:MAG: hypothetical protein HXX14_10090 [Bacteroidetes bacterium]|nr:hypothetical protein [Bacteroidota bacterium]
MKANRISTIITTRNTSTTGAIRGAKKNSAKDVISANNCIIIALIVPVLHTIRTALGSFFLYSYGK